jgi:hypothetical protein
LGPGGVLMRPDHRAVHEMDRPIELAPGVRIREHGLEELLPTAVTAPAAEAAGHGLPGAEALREVAPRRPGAELPEDGVEEAAMIPVRSTGARFGRREQGLHPRPLRVRQGMACCHPKVYATNSAFADMP